MSTYVLLRVVHITLAALWFAAPLGLVSLLRSGLSTSPEAFKMSCAISSKRGKISAIAGLLTLLSGIAIIFHMGGFGSVPPQIHAAMGLVVLMLVLSVGVLKPLGAKLAAIADKGIDDAGRAEAQAILKKVSMLTMITHSAWLVILVLMYWR